MLYLIFFTNSREEEKYKNIRKLSSFRIDNIKSPPKEIRITLKKKSNKFLFKKKRQSSGSLF